MGTFALTGQNVNGDPFLSGGNINITNNAFTDLVFLDVDDLLGITLSGEFVSLDGGVTYLSYDFLGYGEVRGDPLQLAGFIRIDIGDGTYVTVAIDMNADGDRLPNLQNGNSKLKVAALDDTTSSAFPPPPCFAAGTMIETESGPRPVETILEGTSIRTLDAGLQRVIWSGCTTVDARAENAPVLFRRGALGNTADLYVSPQHRMLLSDWRAELLVGQHEVFVPAKNLINGKTILRAPTVTIRYYHLLLPSHQIIRSAGIWSESFYPGAQILNDMRLHGRVARVLPDPQNYGPVARPTITSFEARALAA